MCSGIARCLKPGGRFVTVNSNPACDFAAAPSYRKYGFETSVVGPFREGAPITWTFYLEGGPFSIENYFLDREIHEAALRAAVTSVKVVEIGVEFEVAIGQAARGGSLLGSASSGGGVSSAIPSICM